MSRIKIIGNSSGTGDFTLTSPNSDTSRTLTLPDHAGTILASATIVVDETNGRLGIGTGTPATALDVNGTVTANGLSMGDSEYAYFGASNDLQIYHDGSNSYISDEGTGTLRIRSSNQLVLQVGDDAGGWENAILANNNAGVDLRYNNSTKLSTTGTGVNVTGKAVGTLTTDNDGSFDMNASNNFKCTPSGPFTLTFTNITSGQTGQIILVNTGGYTVSAAATTKVSSTALATISTAGTYVLSYISDGTNAYVVNSGSLS